MKSSLKIAVLLVLVAAVYAKPASSKEELDSANRCAGQKDGTKFPDMKDCKKYVRCEKSKETSKSCESGNRFDAVSLNCVKTASATCFQAVTTTTTTQKPTTTTKRTTTKKTTTTTTEAPLPECFSVHASNCGMYYACDEGEPHWEECLEGYIYYPKLHSCLPGDLETCKLYSLN